MLGGIPNPHGHPMLERETVIGNRLGLHARAAAKLVQTVQGFQSKVWLHAKGHEVDARSIMGVMMLAAGTGTPLGVRADGADEAAALAAVIDLVERKFDEGA
jgi:phosphocarrier protein